MTFPFFNMERTYEYGSYRLADEPESPNQDSSPQNERD